MKDLYLDNAEFRARIRNQYGTIPTFAAAVGLDPETVATRIYTPDGWELAEMKQIIRAMNLSAEETNRYFFTETTERTEKLTRLSTMAEFLTDEEIDNVTAICRILITDRDGIPG